MPAGQRRLADAAAVRAVAHPTRVSLLEALLTRGPQTATRLAEAAGVSPSNASWHLRQLAAAGLVRPARGRDARSRPWQAVSEAWAWQDPSPADSPESLDGTGSSVAAAAMSEVVLQQELHRLRTAQAARDGEPGDWRAATGVVRATLCLTAGQTACLHRELSGLLARYAALPDDADQVRDEDGVARERRGVTMVGWLVPTSPPP